MSEGSQRVVGTNPEEAPNESAKAAEKVEKPRIRRIVRSAATRANEAYIAAQKQAALDAANAKKEGKNDKVASPEAAATLGSKSTTSVGDVQTSPVLVHKDPNEKELRIFDARAPRVPRDDSDKRRPFRARANHPSGRSRPDFDYPRPPDRPGTARARSGRDESPRESRDERPMGQGHSRNPPNQRGAGLPPSGDVRARAATSKPRVDNFQEPTAAMLSEAAESRSVPPPIKQEHVPPVVPPKVRERFKKKKAPLTAKEAMRERLAKSRSAAKEENKPVRASAPKEPNEARSRSVVEAHRARPDAKPTSDTQPITKPSFVERVLGFFRKKKPHA